MPAQAGSGHGWRAPTGDTRAHVQPPSPWVPPGRMQAVVPSPCCLAVGPQQEGRVRCGFSQPWGCRWLSSGNSGNRKEGRGHRDSLAHSQERGPNPAPAKSPRGFARASSPSLLLRAAQQCPHLPPMALPYGGAAAAQPLPHRALAGAGPNPHPAAAGHCQPPPCTRHARAARQRCSGPPAGGSRRAGRPAEPRLFVALMLNSQR